MLSHCLYVLFCPVPPWVLLKEASLFPFASPKLRAVQQLVQCHPVQRGHREVSSNPEHGDLGVVRTAGEERKLLKVTLSIRSWLTRGMAESQIETSKCRGCWEAVLMINSLLEAYLLIARQALLCP